MMKTNDDDMIIIFFAIITISSYIVGRDKFTSICFENVTNIITIVS